MANSFFESVEVLQDKLILVDAFKDKNRKNAAPLKVTLSFLKSGGALGVFPAGTVSHLEFGKKHVTDPEWSDTLARIVKISGATVVPVHFSGRNSRYFNYAGLIHSNLNHTILFQKSYFMRIADFLLSTP